MDERQLALTKAAYHRRQADLPFDAKIRAVVQMQKTALEFSKAGFRKPPRFVWDIDDQIGPVPTR